MTQPLAFLADNQRAPETLRYAVYYAPRGRQRLYNLGGQLGSRYLTPSDLLVGVMGSEGAGKSTLIRGLFPGLELTNDDEGVNARPATIYAFDPDDFFAPHTFHIDIRYELAFRQRHEIVEAVRQVLESGRRVVVEHFDLLHDALGFNAQILFGIGEEVIVARPTILGPYPHAIKSVVELTGLYRRMAHSAEDLTSLVLARDYGYTRDVLHSDVKRGFVIKFSEVPDISIAELESKVLAYIADDLPIARSRRSHITFGDMEMYCTGTRIHVASTARIENFRLLKDYIYEPITKEYLLVGVVGHKMPSGIEELNEMDSEL